MLDLKSKILLCGCMALGFPKSMNIGVELDKRNGVESEVVGVGKSGGGETHTRTMKNELQNGGYSFGGEYTVKKATNKWAGWGTQLKPAYEPILVAKKPVENSILDNIEKYGVGGINIDECRIPLEDNYEFKTTNRKSRSENAVFNDKNNGFDSSKLTSASANPEGRFPANVILTYSDEDKDEVCSGFPYTKSTGGSGTASKTSTFKNTYNGGWGHNKECANLGGLGDEGSAARYFYCAKATNKDRDEGLEGLINTHNVHPTVKPLELMKYLIRLVTPKGGTVLDPFMGSGTTGKAVIYENKERDADYKFVGVELSEEYCTIANARISYANDVQIVQTIDENDNVVTEAKPLHQQRRLF
jgi:site-specific DNA-methyltransferase (adenine-specific)